MKELTLVGAETSQCDIVDETHPTWRLKVVKHITNKAKADHTESHQTLLVDHRIPQFRRDVVSELVHVKNL